MHCSEPIIEPCVSCIHPLEYLFELSYVGTLGFQVETNLSSSKFAADSGSSGSSFYDVLNGYLDRGLNFLNCKYCCPKCGDGNSIYVLSSNQSFGSFAEAFGMIEVVPIPAISYEQELPKGCCLNTFSSTETFIELFPFIKSEFVNSCCSTDFSNCNEELLCYLTQKSFNSNITIDNYLSKGVVEYGAILNDCNNSVKSGICVLLDFLKKYENSFSRTNQSFGQFITQILDRILSKGIVIYCNNNEMVISSIETFLIYAVGIGLVNEPDPVP